MSRIGISRLRAKTRAFPSHATTARFAPGRNRIFGVTFKPVQIFRRDPDAAADVFGELTHISADIIITDYHSQPLDGLDFVRLVSTTSDSYSTFVPIIMLLEHPEMRKIMEASDAGVHEFLAKHIPAKSLYSRIDSIIARPREFFKTQTFFRPDPRQYGGCRRRGWIVKGRAGCSVRLERGYRAHFRPRGVDVVVCVGDAFLARRSANAAIPGTTLTGFKWEKRFCL